MPRKPNSKCLACTQLSVEEARQLHGPVGDGCWQESTCHRRRSHYRHHNANKRKLRDSWRQKAWNLEIIPAPELKASPAATLVLYRHGCAKDALVHAVEVQVWQGNAMISKVETVHVQDFTPSQLNQYMVQVLQVLQQRYGITRFAESKTLLTESCPICSGN